MKAPVYKAPVAVAPSWTGFYIGANLGYGWGNRDADYTANDPASALWFTFSGGPSPTTYKTSGVLGGLQLGYNWQFNRNWVAGLETDFNFSDINGSGSSTGLMPLLAPVPFTTTLDEHIKWFGTVRARLGYLATDNLLAYVTGGFAYGRVERTGSYVNTGPGGFLVSGGLGGFGINCTAFATCFSGSSSKIVGGWTVGGGLEYAVWKNVNLKAEYLYVSLDSQSFNDTASAVFLPGETPASMTVGYGRTVVSLARLGLNYRF